MQVSFGLNFGVSTRHIIYIKSCLTRIRATSLALLNHSQQVELGQMREKLEAEQKKSSLLQSQIENAQVCSQNESLCES